MMLKRAVFLDRDGVLVETLVCDTRAYAPVSLDQFRIEHDARKHIVRLNRAGLLPIVFTNQPDVGRRVIAPDTLRQMHERLQATVPVRDVFVCTHGSEDGCDCRKPKPGMLRVAAKKWGIDLRRSFVVGDRWSDIEAGRAVGCYTILIERTYSGSSTADICVRDLASAVDVVLSRVRSE